MAADADNISRPVFLDYSLYEAGAGHDEEPVAKALCIFLGLADAAAPAVDALYALRRELGRTLCAANALGHEDESHSTWSLQEFLVVNVIT